MALDPHRNVTPIVNCACEGSRLCPPYENLMPAILGGTVSSQNHSTHPSVEKLSSMKSVPGAKKVGEPLY